MPFPFPNFGNGFFSFPSRSRILGMCFFHFLPVPEFREWNHPFPFSFPNAQKSFPLTPGRKLWCDEWTFLFYRYLILEKKSRRVWLGKHIDKTAHSHYKLYFCSKLNITCRGRGGVWGPIKDQKSVFLRVPFYYAQGQKMTRIEFKGRLVQIDHSWNIGPAGPRPEGPRWTYRQNEMDQTLILNDIGETMTILDSFRGWTKFEDKIRCWYSW